MQKKSAWWIVAAAVVIIAVLLALFSVGVKTPVVYVPSCLSAQNFYCTYPVLHNGTFTAALGQNTGATWTETNIFFVISGSPAPTSVPPLPCEQGIPTAIGPGQIFNVSLLAYSNSNTCAGMPDVLGSVISGALWAGYRTSPNGTEQFVQIATVYLKAD